MPLSRTRVAATALLVGAVLTPTASAVAGDSTSARGRAPSPASYTVRVADPVDDVYTEETDVEETLRLSDLSEVTYKVNRVSQRLVVTYVVPEVHRVPFLAQIFTTTLYRPTRAGQPERVLGGFTATFWAQRDPGEDGRAYYRTVSAGTPDETRNPGCKRARAVIHRDTEATDRVVFSVPLRCFGRAALRPGTTAESGSRVVESYGDHLAFDNTARTVVAPRR